MSSATTTTTPPLSKLKPEQAVKELSKKKNNKLCFDCGRSGPQSNVNLTTHTFVCSVCAGLLRSYSHKIKTINMADFTAAEVEELEKMGNKKARKIWKAKLDDNIKIEIDNIEQIKTIMAATYKDKKYYKDPNEKKKKKTADKDKKKEKDDESDSDSDSDDEADKKKKKKNKIKKKVAIADSAGAAKDNTTGFTSDPFANNSSSNAPSSEKKDTGIDFLSNLDFVEAPIPDRRNSNGGGGRLSFSSAFGGQSSSNSVFDNNNHKGGGSVFPDHSSSSHNGNGAIVSLRSADDPAVQFLLNQLKIAAKQFDLLPADVKAVVHTTLQVYEKSLQQAAKEGKDITKVNNDVDHFLDLDAQVQDAANSSGNPFDDDYDDADTAATTVNPFGGAGVGVSSPTNIFGGGAMPAPAAASPINPYTAQMNAAAAAAAMAGVGGGLNAAALYNQQQQQQLSQQMQQQLIIQQRMQQQMVQQQQQAVAAAMMAGQQFYPQAVGAATMQPFPTAAATPQQNLFNVPAAQPQPPSAQPQPAKHDIFAALNPFP